VNSLGTAIETLETPSKDKSILSFLFFVFKLENISEEFRL